MLVTTYRAVSRRASWIHADEPFETGATHPGPGPQPSSGDNTETAADADGDAHAEHSSSLRCSVPDVACPFRRNASRRGERIASAALSDCSSGKCPSDPLTISRGCHSRSRATARATRGGVEPSRCRWTRVPSFAARRQSASRRSIPVTRSGSPVAPKSLAHQTIGWPSATTSNAVETTATAGPCAWPSALPRSRCNPAADASAESANLHSGPPLGSGWRRLRAQRHEKSSLAHHLDRARDLFGGDRAERKPYASGRPWRTSVPFCAAFDGRCNGGRRVLTRSFRRSLWHGVHRDLRAGCRHRGGDPPARHVLDDDVRDQH